jgi:uncharacterized protein with ParB-like and HNH nuclease domain
MIQKNIGAMDENNKEELGEDGSKTGVEFEEEELFDTPFNPDSISIESRVVTMDALIRRFRQGSINLAPNFQRKMVWDDKRRSRLIESMMLKIPLPMFYVAATSQGTWDVVDGLQRLSAIRDFILGDKDKKILTLSNLEFWGERFNGKTFKEIDEQGEYARIVNSIMETELRFTLINPGTPEEVKRNVFRRINTGGMPLTPQEIRHALYQGKSTKLLARFANASSFKNAIGSPLGDSRMAAQEIILRFLAFSLRDYKTYEVSMDTFLSNTMQIINNTPNLSDEDLKKIFQGRKIPEIYEFDIKGLQTRFNTAMTRNKALFGKHAFRKSCGSGGSRSPVHKALFESFGNVLVDLEQEDFEFLLEHKETLHNLCYELMNNDGFIADIGRGSTSVKGVKGRYMKITKMIDDVLERGVE